MSLNIMAAASAASALAWSRQNGSWPNLTLLTSHAMAMGSLSLSLSLELLLSFQRKVKFLPFAGIYSTPSSEASPLVIPVAKEKVVLCCGLCPEFRSGFVS